MKSLAKILLPVDFSERSLGAARYAKTLSDHFHSELTLLHVLTPPHYEFGALEVGGSMLTELYTNRAAQVEKELETFLAGELAGTEARRVVLEGDPARQIVEYAHQQEYRPDRDAHPRLRPVPPIHPRIHHRQGVARCGLPGVDRRAPGRSAPAGGHAFSGHPVRHRSGSAKLSRLSNGPRPCRRNSTPASPWSMRFPYRRPRAGRTPTHARWNWRSATIWPACGQSCGTQAESRGRGRRSAEAGLRNGRKTARRLAGDRPRLRRRRLRPAAHQCLRHHPPVALPGGQRLARWGRRWGRRLRLQRVSRPASSRLPLC